MHVWAYHANFSSTKCAPRHFFESRCGYFRQPIVIEGYSYVCSRGTVLTTRGVSGLALTITKKVVHLAPDIGHVSVPDVNSKPAVVEAVSA